MLWGKKDFYGNEEVIQHEFLCYQETILGGRGPEQLEGNNNKDNIENTQLWKSFRYAAKNKWDQLICHGLISSSPPPPRHNLYE